MYSEPRPTDARVSVIGYGSVRSPRQIDDPDFARQEAIVVGFCQRRGWELVALVPGPNSEQLVAYMKRPKE